jgi:hypothetical protein
MLIDSGSMGMLHGVGPNEHTRYVDYICSSIPLCGSIVSVQQLTIRKVFFITGGQCPSHTGAMIYLMLICMSYPRILEEHSCRISAAGAYLGCAAVDALTQLKS